MVSLEKAMRSFRVCYKAENRSQRTIDTTIQSLNYFAEFLSGVADVTKVDADDLRAFIIALGQKKKWSNRPHNKSDKLLSPFTVAKYVRSIRAFWSWLEREKIIKQNPFKRVKVPKTPETVVPSLSERDIGALLRQINTKRATGFRDYAVLLTLLDTGIRCGELANLRLEDANLEDGYLRVMGKGKRERIVPIGQTTGKALARYLVKHRPESDEASLFVTTTGKALTVDRIEKQLANYSQRAGLGRVHPHQLRHQCALMSLRNGASAFTVQKLLGHRQITTTQLYVHLLDRDVAKEHKKFGAVDNLRLGKV